MFDRAEIGYGLGIAALDAYHGIGLTGRQEFEDSLAETLQCFGQLTALNLTLC